ncbi:MAG: lytic transglycosylase domain-containing protein [Deltaproteobacteria bacterium]|nr:lytic transglycosylase domain-containing protein [Deltaproteobacteria bacterium]
MLSSGIILAILFVLSWIYTFGYFESRNTHIYKTCFARQLIKELAWEGAARSCLRDVVASSSAKYRVDSRLVWAVIAAESNFNYRAVSPRGAMGFMQIMPSTARELGVSDPFDPQENILAGARYLRRMLDKFNGDYRMALAAYNAGPAKVKNAKGIPDISETKAYVDKIMRELEQSKG